MQSQEQDINDVFEDILFIEDKIIEKGYQEGYNTGVQEENVEGYHLGYHRGAEIGAQLGYFSSFTNYSTEHLNLSEKQHKIALNIKNLIEKFPQINSEDDIVQKLSEVQAEFKKFTSLLKVDAPFNELNKLTF